MPSDSVARGPAARRSQPTSRSRHVHLPPARQVERIQGDLRKAVCSAAWFDHCWAAACAGLVPLKRYIQRELDRVAVYPPGGSAKPLNASSREPRRRTIMRRCATCGGTWYPPQYIRRDGRCEDCHAAAELPPEFAATDHRTHRSSTSSPSAMAIRQLDHYGIRLIETALPTEDESALRAQVRCYVKSSASGTSEDDRAASNAGASRNKNRALPA